MTNPFDLAFDAAMPETKAKPAPVAPEIMANPAPWEPPSPIITAPGAYSDIDIDIYHGHEICPGPSISPTGAKLLCGRGRKGETPRHFWEQSNLNPNRRIREETDALRFGKALHDALLLSERWQEAGFYHILPEGFNRAAKVKQAAEIQEADEAAANGLTLIGADDAILINAMVKAVRANKFANLLLSNGEPEVTLAAPDPKLGTWVRTRPDFLPDKKMVLFDVKTAADASFDGFSRAIKDRRYDLAAAMQMDIVSQLYGPDPSRKFVHLVIEKPTKYRPGDYIPVALWELPSEDITRGRHLFRRAINVFADCLHTGEWPGYADMPAPCGLPGYEAKQIDDGANFDGISYRQKND